MATREHLALYKLAYDEESAHSERLARRAEICLLIVTLLVAAVFVKLDFVLEVARRNWFTLGLATLICLCLLGGFGCAATCLLFRFRERLFAAGELENPGQKDSENDLSLLATRTLYATRQTCQMNDRREIWLKVTTTLILIGVAATFSFLVAAALSAPQAGAKAAAPKPNKPAANTSETGKGNTPKQDAKPKPSEKGSAVKTQQPTNKAKGR
jgi:hypothetical protein